MSAITLARPAVAAVGGRTIKALGTSCLQHGLDPFLAIS
jgi:hypothetical protein